MRRWVRRHRALSTVIVLALVLGAAFLFYRSLFQAADYTEVQYVTQPAETGTLVVTVDGTGNFVAGQTYDVVPSVSGTVTGLTVESGDTVTEGQTLFVLENEQLAIDVTSAEIAYKQAEAAVLNAEAAETQAEQSLDQLNDSSSSGGGGSTTPSVTPTSAPPTSLPPTTLPPTTLPPTTFPPTTCPPTTLPTTTTTSPPPSTTTPPTSPTSTTTTTAPDPDPAPATAEAVALASIESADGTTAASRAVTLLAATSSDPGGATSSTGTTLVVAQTSSTPTAADIEIAEQKLEAARIGTEVAYDNLEIAEFNLQQARDAAAAATVAAPGDGVITTLNVSDGDYYSSSGASGGASATGAGGGGGGTTSGTGSSGSALTIVDPTALSAEIQLSEVDIPKVEVGQKATLTVDALPDLMMAGKVTAVDLVGTVEQGVVNYEAIVVPDLPDPELRAGMTTAASVITQVAQNALLVPSSAVKSSSDGSYYVETLVNETPRQVTIEVGLTDGTSTEVLSGLEKGEEVVVQTTGGSTTATTSRNGGFGFPGGGGPGEGGFFLQGGPGG